MVSNIIRDIQSLNTDPLHLREILHLLPLFRKCYFRVIQEFIHVFPAIPSTWEDVSFTSLRGDGAFLISAKMEKGNVTHVEIISEKGGELKLRNPFRNHNFKCSSAFTVQDDILHIPTTEGRTSF